LPSFSCRAATTFPSHVSATELIVVEVSIHRIYAISIIFRKNSETIYTTKRIGDSVFVLFVKDIRTRHIT
jgi:hypothetical protein